MLSLGYDIGSSFIKCTFLDCHTGKAVARGSYPAEEMKIATPRQGWAEQNPDDWWSYVVRMTKNVMREKSIKGTSVGAIGISYQMHGLVLVDDRQKVLRPSIIWCDSRAVDIGRKAFSDLGEQFCLSRLLNSPGNFTASKLRWVREEEPDTYKRIHKAMLPGDYIAMRLTGEIVTTVSGLSEGIYWDFSKNALSKELLKLYDIDEKLLPKVCPTFSVQGTLTKNAAEELEIAAGIPVAYRAGDQPNNAFSLNVLNPGEVAATAGTSGVVYGVLDKVTYDAASRVNPFAHVTHTPEQIRLGILLCINGTGILNSWARKQFAAELKYDQMNTLAAGAPVGSDGVVVIPFGNGAERILENKNVGAHIAGVDFNTHTRAHILRAVQEGIAFSFRYGMDIMREMGVNLTRIRAGNANMFLSPVFRQVLSDCTGASIELFDTDGAEGAARGAAIGAGIVGSFAEVFRNLNKIEEVRPVAANLDKTASAYAKWLAELEKILKK